MDLLKKLYMAFSPSRFEGETQQIILKFLKANKIRYNVDSYGQIYSIKKDQPVLSAHMDQVSSKPIKRIKIDGNYVSADGNLGADDKNGIWIALKMLEKKPSIGFHFSVQEECGGVPFHADVQKAPYIIVMDRNGAGDIIGAQNNYCSLQFQDLVFSHLKQFGYKPTAGIYSDCDRFSALSIPSVNLSCGYYNAHSSQEYTVISELFNALDAVSFLVKALPTTRKKEWNPQASRFMRFRDPLKYLDDEEQKCDVCGQWEYKEFLQPLKGYPGILVCEDCKQYFEQEMKGVKP